MSQPFDEYKALDTPAGQHVETCPVCGAAGALWQYSESERGAASKAVMCTNGDAFGPQDGIVNEGCLLYMPPRGFYKATIREAIRYWNEYAKALRALRRQGARLGASVGVHNAQAESTQPDAYQDSTGT